MLSPLQLHRYYIEEFSCKANPSFKKGAEVNCQGLQIAFQTGTHDKDSLKKRIRLTISQDLSKGGNEPFSFKVVLVGFFEVVKEFFDKQGAEKTEQIVNANAPALLYSAARELLAIISSRGPYSEKDFDILLPSITFINFKPTKEEFERETKGKTTKKIKAAKGD